jgi:predicted NBD/HSP70 family sugar kinase
MYLLADIGGTKMRIAVTRNLRSFDAPIIIDTPTENADLLRLFVETVHSLAKDNGITHIVVGKPLWAKRYPAFENDVKKALAPAAVDVLNDTALVGLGEAYFGAGTGSSIFVYITVSTGINGVRIVDGSIDRSVQGFEIGGQYLATEGTISLEDLIAGRSVQEHYGVHPKELGKDHPFWEEAARILAYGLHNTILHWSPDRVAIGGSMMKEIGIPLPRVESHLKEILKKFPTAPEIVPAKLEDLGGLWGGIAKLQQLTVRS